ncbi:MMPL family transporter [Lentzea alba]
MRVLAGVLLVVWLALGGFTGPYAGKLSEVAENDSSAFLPNSAESTQVAELQKKFQRANAIPAIVVVERAGGLTEADKAYLAERGKGFQASPVIPAPNDNEAAQLVVLLDPTKEVRDSVLALRDGTRGAPPGLTVLVTGPAAQVADLVEAFGGIDGLLLIVAGAVVALILLVVYRSPLLPIVVLMSAVFALGLASFVVYLLAKNDVLALNGQSQGILSILVFGAATDYALLLVSRFREELRDTQDKYAAIRTAWRGTIEPIAASAGTVILGVLCLLFSDLDSNKGLGPVAAIGIGAALLTAMTFLPAVLALCGRASFWPFAPKFGSPHPETTGLWGRTADLVRRRPRAIWITTAIVLLVGAAFLPQLKASGTAQSDVFLTEVESVAGQEVLSKHFPGGTGSPTVIIAAEGKTAEVLQKSKVEGVADVRPTGTAEGLVRVEATLKDAPDSDAAVETVQRIRAAVHGIDDAKVGGQTATLLDTRKTSEHDRLLIIPIVLVVIFLVLALLLRSLLAPVLLIGTVVLSFAATMGVSALVFNHVFDFPGSDPVVPLFGFVFLVALGIDYNIFLMTRVREETQRLGTVEGTLRGLSLTGGVITSAGVVLAATFAALAVLPILFLTQIAFIVAFGVLLDTLLVRSLLVPALSVDIGGRIWWPSKLR